MKRLTETERNVLEMIQDAGGSYLPDNIDPAAKELLRDLVKKRRLIWEETDAGVRYHLAQGWSA